MQIEHFNGTVKTKEGELKELLKEAGLELKKEDVKSVKIVKPLPKNTFPKKRKKRK